MAANIFTLSDYAEIQNRIHQLSSQSKRKWGKMTLNQMLTHCGIQLKTALGLIPESAFEGPTFFRTSVGRWLLLYGIPWPKGAATPSGMNMEINHAKTLETKEAKYEILTLLEQVQRRDSFNAHPFFGKMDKKNWGRLIWKHLDHHLKQFGS